MNYVNGRLRDLAMQAAGGMLCYTDDGEFRLSEKECQEFAWLITQECIDALLFHGNEEGATQLDWLRRNRLQGK